MLDARLSKHFTNGKVQLRVDDTRSTFELKQCLGTHCYIHTRYQATINYTNKTSSLDETNLNKTCSWHSLTWFKVAAWMANLSY